MPGPPSVLARIRTSRAGLLLAGSVASVAFAHLFATAHVARRLHFPNVEGYTLEAVLDGEAVSPFRYRVLVPWIINLLEDLPLPGAVDPWVVVQRLETVCLVALTLVLWSYLGTIHASVRMRTAAVLLGWGALVATYLLPTRLTCFYWYDIPAVLVLTLGLLFLRRGRMVPFYLVLAIGTLNRETTIFLIPAFLLANPGKPGRRGRLLHAVAMGLLWLAIKILLELQLGDGAPRPAWFTLGRNLEALTRPGNLLLIAASLGFVPLFTLCFLRRIHDPFVRRQLLVAPLFVLGMLLVGYVEEIRIYGELLPVFLAGAHAILTSGEPGTSTGRSASPAGAPG